jgi:hypothetical protein
MKGEAFALLLLGLLPALVAADPLTEAFSAGSSLGQSGSQAAHSSVTTSNASSKVPAYTATPAETKYFGSAGLGPSAALARQCKGNTPGCQAIRYSQTNPGKRAEFTLSADDVLIKKGQTIASDPQSIAGNLAGSYSACTVQSTTSPAPIETRICHQYRTAQTSTCDKILVVKNVQIPGCTPGKFLVRVAVNPCSSCIDQPAFDFSCAASGYRLVVNSIAKTTGETLVTAGGTDVPGGVNVQLAKTAGPSKRDDFWCYQTFFSQSCTSTTCTITVWFNNPCTREAATSKASFKIPTTTGISESWDNQCATLEARAR